MSDPSALPPEPRPSDLREEFDALMRRTGLTVAPSQRDRLLPGYAELKRAAEMLRGRPHTAEPSNIFALKPFGAVP